MHDINGRQNATIHVLDNRRFGVFDHRETTYCYAEFDSSAEAENFIVRPLPPPDPAGEGGPVVQNNQFRANNCTDTWLRWCADKHVAEIRDTVAARGHTTIVRWPDARYRAAVIEALQDAGYNVKVYPAFTGVDDK